MHSEEVDPRLAALAATLKVLSRLAPHSRHDVLGACSPISLDISVLGVKAAKAPLNTEDISPFIGRAKANVSNIVQQLDRMVLLQRQDRRPVIAVAAVLEKTVHAMRTVFSSIGWEACEDASTLGTASEYDLTMAVSAAVMALYDQHGANKALNMAACQDQDGLLIAFTIAPASDEGWLASNTEIPPSQRIALHEARYLAEQLDFVFMTKENGITLRRV